MGRQSRTKFYLELENGREGYFYDIRGMTQKEERDYRNREKLRENGCFGEGGIFARVPTDRDRSQSKATPVTPPKENASPDSPPPPAEREPTGIPPVRAPTPEVSPKSNVSPAAPAKSTGNFRENSQAIPPTKTSKSTIQAPPAPVIKDVPTL